MCKFLTQFRMTRLARLTALQSYVKYIFIGQMAAEFLQNCARSLEVFRSELQLEKQLAGLFGDKKGVFFAQLQGRIRSQSRTFIGKNSRSISIGITVGYADGLACLVTRNVFFFAQRRGRLRSRSRTSCHTSSSAEVCPSRFFIVGSLTIVW